MPRKSSRPLSAATLRAVTGRYLEQRSTTSSHLRRLLMQRVRRSVAEHGGDPSELASLVDAEITRLSELGLLDDQQWAADRARSVHRRGGGSRKIAAALHAKGLGSEAVAEAVADLVEEVPDAEWQAALTWARKKRLGPWRTQSVDADGRRKELGKLARAGFSFGIAARVVDLPEPP